MKGTESKISKNRIRVFEHEKLIVGRQKSFTPAHLLALEIYHTNNNVEYFSLIRNGVKFKHYVGVIQAGDLTIEILPKADSAVKGDESTWHNVLLQMLMECKFIRVDHVELANLNLKANTILEIYIQLFLHEARSLLHNGLAKKYRETEGNVQAIKGRLNFDRNVTLNYIHQERAYCHFSEYSNDNMFNRLLLKTIKTIPTLTNSPTFVDAVNRLVMDFPELDDCKASADIFERLTFDRKTEQYKYAMLISKMLLLNFRPDITGGSENVIAILFDMNKLWQEFIYTRVKREEVQASIKVSRQSSADFWKPAGKKSKTVRPDIVIEKDGKKIVLDTKWKIMTDNIPSDDDLKQMFIYNLFWECDKSFLLYPSNNPSTGYGDYHNHINREKFQSKCGIEKIQILENNKLKAELGKEILKRLKLVSE